MDGTTIRGLLITGLALATLASDRAAGQVYQTLRHEARANPYQRRSFNPGVIAIGQSGRRRGGPNIVIPGPIVSQQTGPTWSSSRYRVYGHGPRHGFIRHYSTGPGPVRYSIRSEAGRFPTQHGVIHPFPYPIPYGGPLPYGGSLPDGGPLPYGGSIVDPYQPHVYPPPILAPPLVVPYGGFAGSFSTAPSITEYRELPPAPSVLQRPQPSQPAQPDLPEPVPLQHGEPLSRLIPEDRVPLIEEFPTTEETRPAADAIDRIRGLRYQTSGDGAFRGGDYVTAEVFYKTAIETAPRKQAAWLRLVWAQVAQSRYAEAAATLKTALKIQDDPTAALVTATDLYGTRFESRALLLTDGIWKWVEQRPQSTDRLLLAAAFYQMTEQPAGMRDILNEAAGMGLQPSLVEALKRLNPPQAPPATIPLTPQPQNPQPNRPEAPAFTPMPENQQESPSERILPPTAEPELTIPAGPKDDFVPLPPVQTTPAIRPPADISSADILHPPDTIDDPEQSERR